MALVVEVIHSAQHIDYARSKLREHLRTKPANASIGIELGPNLIKRIESQPTLANNNPVHLFYKHLINFCRSQGVKVVPLVDDKVTEMIDRAQQYTGEAIMRLVRQGKIPLTPVVHSLALTSNLPPTQLKKVRKLWKKAMKETDSQLAKRLSKHPPTISLVGVHHGEPLVQNHELIPFPSERISESDHQELDFLKKLRGN